MLTKDAMFKKLTLCSATILAILFSGIGQAAISCGGSNFQAIKFMNSSTTLLCLKNNCPLEAWKKPPNNLIATCAGSFQRDCPVVRKAYDILTTGKSAPSYVQACSQANFPQAVKLYSSDPYVRR